MIATSDLQLKTTFTATGEHDFHLGALEVKYCPVSLSMIYSFVLFFFSRNFVLILYFCSLQFEVLIFIILFNTTGNRIHTFSSFIIFIIKGYYRIDGFGFEELKSMHRLCFHRLFSPCHNFFCLKTFILGPLYFSWYLSWTSLSLHEFCHIWVNFKHFLLESVIKLTWELPFFKSVSDPWTSTFKHDSDV